MSVRKKTGNKTRKTYNLRDREKGKSGGADFVLQTSTHEEAIATPGNHAGTQQLDNATARTDISDCTTLNSTGASTENNMAEAVSHAKFVETTGKIMEKLDTLNSNILAIRNEMSEIRDSVADSSARLTTIENEIIPQIKIDNNKLEKELKDSILQLEIHDRKMNLLIYGVQSKKDEKRPVICTFQMHIDCHVVP